MKRKILLFALMVVAISCIFVLSASAVEHNGLYYSLNDSDKTAALTNENVKCTIENLVIPETITIGEGENAITYTVTTINNEAFSGNTPHSTKWAGNLNIKTVVIPKTVTSIGSHAFRNCKNIQSVVCKASNASFSDAEFFGCASLESMDLSGMENLTKIGQYFCGGQKSGEFCTKLSTIKLPSTVTSIGDNSFPQTAITSLDFLPDGLISIGGYAFNSCKGLTSVELPSSLKTVGGFAFQSCTNITSMKLSNCLESIGRNCFQSTGFEYLVIPATLTSIGQDCFNSAKLKTLVFASTNDLSGFNASAFSSAKLSFVYYAGTNVADFAARFGATKGWSSNNYIAYSDYSSSSPTSNVIVYGTTNCDECSDILGASSLYVTDLVSKMEEKSVCSCGAETVGETYEAPIKYLGYSKKSDGSGSICIGYLVNEESLALYEQKTGKSYTYGVVAYVPSKSDDLNALKPVKDDLTLSDPDYTIFADVSEFDSFEFVLRGFNDDTAKALELVMCAYVSDGSTVNYLGINQETNTASQTEFATLVSFNKFA